MAYFLRSGFVEKNVKKSMRTRATLGEYQLLEWPVHKAMTRFDQHTVKNTFVLLLEVAHVQISMAAVGRPTENAYVERLMRALKEEKVYLHEYRDLEDARQHIKWNEPLLRIRFPIDFEGYADAAEQNLCLASAVIKDVRRNLDQIANINDRGSMTA